MKLHVYFFFLLSGFLPSSLPQFTEIGKIKMEQCKKMKSI